MCLIPEGEGVDAFTTERQRERETIRKKREDKLRGGRNRKGERGEKSRKEEEAERKPGRKSVLQERR